MSTLTEKQFLDFIDQYKNEFHRFTFKAVWNPSEQEDVFADAVMVAWEKRRKFQVGTNFRAWFYKILLNKSFVANRHTKRNAVDLDSITEVRNNQADARKAHRTSDSIPFLEQVDDILLKAVKSLREPERAVLLLRSNECSYIEMASILDIPVGTVMTHLSRGRAKARSFLRQAATPKKQFIPMRSSNCLSLCRG